MPLDSQERGDLDRALLGSPRSGGGRGARAGRGSVALSDEEAGGGGKPSFVPPSSGGGAAAGCAGGSRLAKGGG